MFFYAWIDFFRLPTTASTKIATSHAKSTTHSHMEQIMLRTGFLTVFLPLNVDNLFDNMLYVHKIFLSGHDRLDVLVCRR